METTNASTTPAPAPVNPGFSGEEISKRVEALMIKLLDAIERDIHSGAGALPGPHLATYEALCRAEASRLGR